MLADKVIALGLPEPLRVATGTSVRQVIQTIQQQQAGAVLICDGPKFVGILTERDVLMKVLARDTKYDDPVDVFMTPNPRTLTSESTIGEVIALMMNEGFRNVPIINAVSGEAIALCRVRDIANHLAESFPEHVLNLPPRPHQKMQTPEGA